MNAPNYQPAPIPQLPRDPEESPAILRARAQLLTKQRIAAGRARGASILTRKPDAQDAASLPAPQLVGRPSA